MTTKPSGVPDRGDVILKTANRLDPADMFLLVLSPAEFNERSKSMICLFVSTQEVHATNPFAVSLDSDEKRMAGMYVISNFPVTVHWELDQVEILGRAPEQARLNAAEILNQIIEIGN